MFDNVKSWFCNIWNAQRSVATIKRQENLICKQIDELYTNHRELRRMVKNYRTSAYPLAEKYTVKISEVDEPVPFSTAIEYHSLRFELQSFGAQYSMTYTNKVQSDYVAREIARNTAEMWEEDIYRKICDAFEITEFKVWKGFGR